MKKEELCKLAVDIPSNNFKFEAPDNVKEKTIQGALKSYAKGCAREEIAAIMDATLFHGGKDGFILTEEKLYGYTFPKNPLSLNDLVHAQTVPDKKDHLLLTYRDGSSSSTYFTIFAPYILILLQNILNVKDSQEEIADIPDNNNVQADSADVPDNNDTQADSADVPDNNDTQAETVDAANQNNAQADSPAGELQENSPKSECQADSLADEWQEYEADKLNFDKEKLKFRNETLAFEKERQALEQKKINFEKEQQALEQEKQDFEQEKLIFQNKVSAFEKERQDLDLGQVSLQWEANESKRDRLFHSAAMHGADGFYDNAVLLYKAAAEKEDETALKFLAKCYSEGLGTPANKAFAFSCLEKSAQAGDAQAQLFVSAWYLQGEGTKADGEKAKYWFKKAVGKE